ncbi:GT4 family glycosyltransferase PelF [Saccharibacillus sp. CPCC 101409]|uniref:GT4 family glycosyltransferase PelF n=1 Tax=Saccharibacillus sp. CPCC 101409 TaxID=3058041 RepID=UPI002670E169|nr:GT4 family glycosyltransferase PelF [Saccharibacillus sp. CPCC 101409]MDO3411580.1 GT4 family glycosyltransferase PelF [Saccharibacillus sp. CPCC 101409]
MRICIVAEGSYPYITGGVSSWIHSLAVHMPEHEFVILAIGAEEKQRGLYRYEIPANIVEIKEVFLNSFMNEAPPTQDRLRLTAEERRALGALIGGGKLDWAPLFDLIRSDRVPTAGHLLMSREFFHILSERCAEDYAHVPFTEMYWMVRSMMLPLLLTLREEIPRADLYHSVSTGYAGVVAALGKHLYGKPYILTEHGIYSREREEEIIKADWVRGYFKDLWIRYFYRLSEAAYSWSDEVITLFGRNKEIEVEIGCDERKIRIIPNGVNVADYDLVAGPPAAAGPLRIGAIVRLVPIKDIKTMIQSFALVKKQLPEAELHILGPTEEDEDYVRECRELVLALRLDDVRFTGQVNVREYLGRLDLVVLSSISEGMPLAILEAMAAAKPCVATDVGSCRELLEGRGDSIGPAGLIVPVMHYDRMAGAIVKLGLSRELRERMGANGRARAEEMYTHADFIRSYRELYDTYKEANAWQVSDSN